MVLDVKGTVSSKYAVGDVVVILNKEYRDISKLNYLIGTIIEGKAELDIFSTNECKIRIIYTINIPILGLTRNIEVKEDDILASTDYKSMLKSIDFYIEHEKEKAREKGIEP